MLDWSYNELKTISSSIDGWEDSRTYRDIVTRTLLSDTIYNRVYYFSWKLNERRQFFLENLQHVVDKTTSSIDILKRRAFRLPPPSLT